MGETYPNPVDWLGQYEQDAQTPTAKWNTLLGSGRPENVAARKKKEAEDLQREFAKNGLQWRIEDAKKAGIHPLAALGFQGPSASPIIIDEGPAQGPPPDPNTNFAIQMGSNFGRAMMSSATREERMLQQLNLASMHLDIEGKALDNQIRASQLRNIRQTGPAMPSPLDQEGSTSMGQGNFQVKPSQATSTTRGAPHQQAGAIADMGFARTSDGGYIPVPSTDIKERIEDNIFHEATHFLRNNVVPNLTGGSPPDPKNYPLPKGYDHWKWSYTKQQYMPAKRYKRFKYLPDEFYEKKGFTF